MIENHRDVLSTLSKAIRQLMIYVLQGDNPPYDTVNRCYIAEEKVKYGLAKSPEYEQAILHAHEDAKNYVKRSRRIA